MSDAHPDSYVLVASDAENHNGYRVSAWDIWQSRYSKGIWPLYPRTPNTHALVKGSRLLFYVGGQGHAKQSFVGEGLVREIAEWDYRKGEVDPENWMTTTATSIIRLRDRVLSPEAVLGPSELWVMCFSRGVEVSIPVSGPLTTVATTPILQVRARRPGL